MFANSAFISYVMYTFLVQPSQHGFFFGTMVDMELFTQDRKWMMLTIPFVLYGIMRYTQLIYEGKGESPEQIVTSDVPLIATIIFWGITSFFVLYVVGG